MRKEKEYDDKSVNDNDNDDDNKDNDNKIRKGNNHNGNIKGELINEAGDGLSRATLCPSLYSGKQSQERRFAKVRLIKSYLACLLLIIVL